MSYTNLDVVLPVSEKSIPFGDLDIGDFFTYPDGVCKDDIFMKLQNNKNTWIYNSDPTSKLIRGMVCSEKPDTLTTPIRNVKIIIGGA